MQSGTLVIMVVGTLAFRSFAAGILCYYGIYERCLSDSEVWPVSVDRAQFTYFESINTVVPKLLSNTVTYINKHLENTASVH